MKEKYKLYIPVIYSLLYNNNDTQKMFVEMNHLNDLVPAIQSSDEQAIDFLIMLFSTSNNASKYRHFILGSELFQIVVTQARANTEKRSKFIRLLGWLIRGDSDLCALMTEATPTTNNANSNTPNSNLTATTTTLEIILRTAISSSDQEERNSSLFFIECYLIKSKVTPDFLAKTICQKIGIESSNMLLNFESKPNEVSSLLLIACDCLLANHDTLFIFFNESLPGVEKTFLGEVIEGILHN